MRSWASARRRVQLGRGDPIAGCPYPATAWDLNEGGSRPFDKLRVKRRNAERATFRWTFRRRWKLPSSLARQRRADFAETRWRDRQGKKSEGMAELRGRDMKDFLLRWTSCLQHFVSNNMLKILTHRMSTECYPSSVLYFHRSLENLWLNWVYIDVRSFEKKELIDQG